MNKFFTLFSTLAAVLVLSGCASTDETLLPSEISVDELQIRKDAATDPEGKFSKASSYIMRQNISDSGIFGGTSNKIIELKYKRPDKIKCTVMEDGKAISGYIINGNSAWSIDYSANKVVPIPPQHMVMIKTLTKLNTPATRYKDVFKNVEIFRCKTSDGEFFKLHCSNNQKNSFEIYINASTYLTSRMKTSFRLPSGTLNTDSRMKSYTLYEGIRIPDESVSVTGDEEQTQKVIFYKLDVPVDDNEFNPPVL
ncbi:MAG: hypothetical protein IJC21_03855 [Lentisphaeria bacterium]|nr:hypothetical protein [Lentisphaeria bacterium]MBR7120091.1 hypothetical protein [Lentisphaeria bacterium]